MKPSNLHKLSKRITDAQIRHQEKYGFAKKWKVDRSNQQMIRANKRKMKARSVSGYQALKKSVLFMPLSVTQTIAGLLSAVALFNILYSTYEFGIFWFFRQILVFYDHFFKFLLLDPVLVFFSIELKSIQKDFIVLWFILSGIALRVMSHCRWLYHFRTADTYWKEDSFGDEFGSIETWHFNTSELNFWLFNFIYCVALMPLAVLRFLYSKKIQGRFGNIHFSRAFNVGSVKFAQYRFIFLKHFLLTFLGLIALLIASGALPSLSSS